MELRDVKDVQIPAFGAPRPVPEPGQPRPRPAVRRARGTAYYVAGTLSAFWLGASIAFVFGYLGIEGVLALALHWQVGLGAAIALPIALAWLAAIVTHRAQNLSLAAEDIALIARRLAEPEEQAAREITRIGRAVRREIDALNTGLEGALGRVRTLESLAAERLAEIEQSAAAIDEKSEIIRAHLREEREQLSALALSLRAEADAIGETVKTRAAAIKTVADEAASDLRSARDMIDDEIAAFRAAMDSASTVARDSAQSVERESGRMTLAAEAVESRLDNLLLRQERQRTAVGEAAAALRNEAQALDAAIAKQTDELSRVSATLAEQSQRAEYLAQETSKRTEQIASALLSRTEGFSAAVNRESNNIRDVALAAEAALGKTVQASRSAGESVRAVFDGATQSALSSIAAAAAQAERVSQNLSHQLTEVVAAAQETKLTAAGLADEVRDVLAAMPKAATESAAELRARLEEEHARLNEIVERMNALKEAIPVMEPQPAAPLPEPEPEAELAAEAEGPAPEAPRQGWMGFARRLSGLVRRDASEPAPPRAPSWRMSALLAAAETTRGTADTGRADLQKLSLFVIEKLQAIAIDLDRALEDEPPSDLWRRYIAGERSIFARRLVSLMGKDGVDKIKAKLAADGEFRGFVERYIEQFEALLDEASARDRDNILVETFLAAHTGRLYLILAQAVGRF